MLSFKVTNRSKSRYQLVWGAQTEGCDPDSKFEARLRLDHAWSVEGADLQPDPWPATEVKVQAMRVDFLTQPWKNTRRSFVTQIWNQRSIWSPFDTALTVWPLAHLKVKFSCSLCAVSSVSYVFVCVHVSKHMATFALWMKHNEENMLLLSQPFLQWPLKALSKSLLHLPDCCG